MNKAKNKLVIVEGLTGLGKSTMAHFIARQYQYNGIPATWIHEGEDPHPVNIGVNSNIHVFMDASLKKWEAFIAGIQRSSEVTVIEAGFFNNLVETLFAQCVDQTEIMQFGLKLQDIIKPVQPALVYLAHNDVSTALEKNFLNRGESFKVFVIEYIARTPLARQQGWQGVSGTVAFWKAFVTITDALFKAYEIDKFYLDVSAGLYDRYIQQVIDFLSLSMKPDPAISLQDANKFIGRYRFEKGTGTCNIQYENGALVTDIFVNVKKKLIPKSKNTFIAESWHFELCFEYNPSDKTTTLTVGGRDIEYLKAVGITATKVKE